MQALRRVSLLTGSRKSDAFNEVEKGEFLDATGLLDVAEIGALIDRSGLFIESVVHHIDCALVEDLTASHGVLLQFCDRIVFTNKTPSFMSLYERAESARKPWCKVSVDYCIDEPLFCHLLMKKVVEKSSLCRLYLTMPNSCFHCVYGSSALYTSPNHDLYPSSSLSSLMIMSSDNDFSLDFFCSLFDACRVVVWKDVFTIHTASFPPHIPQLVSSAVGEVFSRERVICSFPQKDHPFMKEWITDYALSCATAPEALSTVVLNNNNNVVAGFCMAKEFGPPNKNNNTDNIDMCEVSAPVDEILNHLQQNVLLPYIHGHLQSSCAPPHLLHPLPSHIHNRLSSSFLQHHIPLLYIALIGSQQSGAALAATTKALHSAKCRGYKFAFAETSGPQSTAACVRSGARIVYTLFFDPFSSFEFVRKIPASEDRNTDVAHLVAKDGSVAPSIRLVMWDLEECKF